MKAIDIHHAQAGSILSRCDGSLKLTYITPELLPSQAAALLPLHGKNVRLTIIPEDVEPEEMVAVTTERDTKTPSQRLRGVLFIHWEQQGRQGLFDTFYAQRMEAIIDGYKQKNLT